MTPSDDHEENPEKCIALGTPETTDGVFGSILGRGPEAGRAFAGSDAVLAFAGSVGIAWALIGTR